MAWSITGPGHDCSGLVHYWPGSSLQWPGPLLARVITVVAWSITGQGHHCSGLVHYWPRSSLQWPGPLLARVITVVAWSITGQGHDCSGLVHYWLGHDSLLLRVIFVAAVAWATHWLCGQATTEMRKIQSEQLTCLKDKHYLYFMFLLQLILLQDYL